MTTTATPSSISSFDPQLLKLLLHHHHHQQPQISAKEYLQRAFYLNQTPPNAVATNLPRHFLGNGSSKLNTDCSILHTKTSSNFQSKKSSNQLKTFDQWLQPPLGSVIQVPSSIQSDTSTTTSDLKTETILSSGERITCFNVGGEKRLCLPEILNTILKDFSLAEINAACERLHIYCSRCTREQLDILKITKVLPLNAPSCGLITQTDAERLCDNLLQTRYKGQIHTINQYERLYSIRVQHKCFGKCTGILYPTLYVAPKAECILCETCQALLSPKRFVSHGHKSDENRICHWGFDSDNWRNYLKIRSNEDRKAREEFELFKEKFLNNNQQKKRLLQQDNSCASIKRTKPIASIKTENNCTDYSQLNHMSLKNDGSTTNHCSLPLPLRAVHSSSPEPKTSLITNFNDFSADGIRHIVESTVSSAHARYQLLSYISQLQLDAYTHSSNTSSLVNQNQLNESILLRHENELLRQRLSMLEAQQMSSSSNKIDDIDDIESNLSSNSASSITCETITNDQPKYFDRKRRLLAAEQQVSTSEIKRSHLHKKSCLDEIVDSLNQKAQAEHVIKQDEQHNEHERLQLVIKEKENNDEDNKNQEVKLTNNDN